MSAEPVTFVNDAGAVSALLAHPPGARACFVLAHGAGAGMTHPFLEAVARELAERGIASLRYQFPFMEQGARRPDPPRLAHATVRAAVAEAARIAPGLALIAGGRSFRRRKRHLRCPAFAGWPYSGSRCTPPGAPPPSAASTSSM